MAGPKRHAVAEPQRPPAAAISYVESSALAAAIFEHDVEAWRAIEATRHPVTSALTIAEAFRAIVRARSTARLDGDQERAVVRGLQTFARRCALVAMSDAILLRAGRPFPVEPVRTLDAIHLATLESLGEPPQLVTVVTRDTRVEANARALGYRVE